MNVIFSCDQADLWMVQSVRLSICPSVHPSHLFHYVPIIIVPWPSWNFQELLPLTEIMSIQKVKVRGQRGRWVTEVKTHCNHFQTVTPIWIHIWQWNDAQSLMGHRRGALMFFKVIRQISTSHSTSANLSILTQIGSFQTVTPVLNLPIALKWCTKLEVV